MRTESDLSALLEPDSIAVIGASEDPTRIGGRVIKYLKQGFGGYIYPVNKARVIVQDIPAFRSVAEVTTAPDLAVIAIPAEYVLGALRECADRGARVAIILSSGFGEAGAEGRRWQDELLRIARDTGMRLIGPNCLGMINLGSGVLATFGGIDTIPRRVGNVALVSQSGALGLMLWECAQWAGVGASYLYTSGNEADVSCAELVSALVDRDDVGAVGLYAETIKEPGVLVDAGRRALSAGKPIVAIIGGSSPSGSRATASHTGTVAIPARVIDALLAKAGIVSVETPNDAVDFLAAASARRVPGGDRLGIVTGSGGLGILMADMAERERLAVPLPSAELVGKLREKVAAFAGIGNPFDLTGQVTNDATRVEQVIGDLVDSDEYDAYCVAGAHRSLGEPILAAQQAGFERTSKPYITTSYQRDLVRQLNQRNVPCVSDGVVAVRTMAALARIGRYRARELRRLAAPGRPLEAVLDGTEAGVLGDGLVRDLLASCGIRMVGQAIAREPSAATAAAAAVGYPVVLKATAEAMAHKSEHEAVRLNIGDEVGLLAAFTELQKTIRAATGLADDPGILVQPMVTPGLELLIGAIRDDRYGAFVTFGFGGKYTEIIDQVELLAAPVDVEDASDAIARFAGGRLRSASRGLTESAHAQLAGYLAGISRLMTENPSISEIDLNPVIVTGESVSVVDQLVVCRPEPETAQAGARRGEARHGDSGPV